MTEGVIIAIIAASTTIAATTINIIEMRNSKIKDLVKAVENIGEGLNIGLGNDRVIFKAFRNHCINGESEEQEKIMDSYFARCASDGYRVGKGKNNGK